MTNANAGLAVFFFGFGLLLTVQFYKEKETFDKVCVAIIAILAFLSSSFFASQAF